MLTHNYGGMFGNIPPAILANGKESLSGMRQLMQVAAAYGRGGGPGISHSVLGQYLVPGDRQIIYGKIRDDEGSGSGSGQPTFNSGDASFLDPDGYTAYAFDEINPFQPWKGQLLEGGVKTTLPVSGVGGGNFAYPLNQDSILAGALCVLIRAGDHWVIFGVEESGDGSGSGQGVSITCADGSQYTATINGNSITVL